MNLRHLFGVLVSLLVISCSWDVRPEEEAAQAALDYYQRLLEGYSDGLLAAKAGVDSLPDDYRKQLEKAYAKYMDDMKEKHGGLQSVTISSNVGRRDTSMNLVYAFLMLSYKDSTQEEITVPMVAVNGEWKIK